MKTNVIPSSVRSGRRPAWESWLALAAGLLMTVGLPPQAGTWPLVPLAMALLFRSLMSSEHPARTAWFFGLAHQASLLAWLFQLDPAKSVPTPALVPVQAVAAILYVSAFYLGLGWAYGRVRARVGLPRSLLVLPVHWVAVEALRSWGELGFPWCLSGSSALSSPWVGLLRASGELGVGAALAFTAALVAALLARRSHAAPVLVPGRTLLALGIGAVVVWLGLTFGAQATPPAPGSHAALADSLGAETGSVAVAAIQADVALADKWSKAHLDSTTIPYAALSAQAGREGARLIVWAETAVPAYVRFDIPLMTWLRQTVVSSGAWLYAGFPDADRGPDGQVRTFNSSGLFDPTGFQRDRYAKHHLLPIGEAMPFQRIFPFLAKVDVGQAEWIPGPAPQPMNVALAEGAFRISGLVCFESVFGALARDSVRRGSQCLVVITNDGWFGESAGPRQHAWLARLRAIECGVPVIRCANNGISFIADADGRVLDSLDLGQRGIVRAEITPGGGRTLYVRAGAWPLFGWLVLWFLAAVALPLRRSR